MNGQFKQKKVTFSLNRVANRLITRAELDTVATDFMQGTTGDLIADKVIAEFLETRKWDLPELKIFVKRVYYLGMLEGTRRINADPRVRYVKVKNETKTLSRDSR
jgi:hypothetical protein